MAVVGVALVGVVDEDFAVDAVDKRFPDARGTVGSVWWAGRNNSGDVFPGVAAVTASLELDVGGGEVLGDGVTGGSSVHE